MPDFGHDVEEIVVEIRMLKKKFFDFSNDESGATAIEYGLIAAIVSIVIIVSLGAVGDELNIVFNRVACALEGGEFSAPDICDEPT